MEASGQPLGEREKWVEGLVRTSLSEDQMRAFVSVPMKADRKKLTVKDLQDLLARQGVVFGVKRARIKSLLRKLAMGEEVVRYQLAEGLRPSAGKDAVLTVRVDSALVAGVEDEAERMAFRERKFICRVRQGQLLFDLSPAGEGIPGRTVTGEEIPPAPGQTELPGELVNVYDEQGMRYYAAVDGQFRFSPERVEVAEDIHVDGDVDFSVGNLDYDGAIRIDGNVRQGFQVVSRAAITIGGNVGRGVLLRCEGPITIGGDVGTDARIDCQGDLSIGGRIGCGMGGVIGCEGNLTAEQILDSRVAVGGNLSVTRLIMGSLVVCRGHVTMLEENSEIRGGRVEGVEGLTVAIAGTAAETPTVLVSGITLAYHEESKRVGEEAGELGRRIDTALRNYQARYATTDPQQLSGEALTRYLDAKGRVDQTQTTGMARLGELKQRRQELREKFARSDENTMIKVLDRVLPGVEICVGSKARLIVTETIERDTFYEHRGEIRRLSEG